jgi:streptogramin lyase
VGADANGAADATVIDVVGADANGAADATVIDVVGAEASGVPDADAGNAADAACADDTGDCSPPAVCPPALAPMIRELAPDNPLGKAPANIVEGPDGNLWFTLKLTASAGSSGAAGSAFGRITRAGVVTEFQVPTPGAEPLGIAKGPDGNVWLTEFYGNNIARVAPDGTVTEFPILTAASHPNGIVAGPDGNLWFTEQQASQIGRMSTAGDQPVEFSLGAGRLPTGITAGPDGNLWFAEQLGDRIGCITPSGAIQEFTIPHAGGYEQSIVAGPDGNLWFVENGNNMIARSTPTGAMREFSIPTAGSGAWAIATGPDGNLWFTEGNANQIGRITPSGVVTEFVVPTANSSPSGLAAGGDGNLWFAEGNADQIGRLTPGSILAIDATSTLFAFDRAGNPLGSAALQGPIGSLNGGGLAVASGLVYVANGAPTNGVEILNPALESQAFPTGAFGGLFVPRGIAFDCHDSDLFVANGGGSVSVFDRAGAPLAVASGFPGYYGPSGIAYDADDDTIWVANYTGGASPSPPIFGVSEYTEGGAQARAFDYASQFVAPGAHQEPYSITVCPRAATRGMTQVVVGFIDDGSGQGSGAVQVYSTDGTPAGTPRTGYAKPYALSCDSRGLVYVADATGLRAFDLGDGGSDAGLAGAFAGMTAPIFGVLAGD